MKRSARVAYSFLFFLAIVISWIMRDFARPLIEKIPCTSDRRGSCLHGCQLLQLSCILCLHLVLLLLLLHNSTACWSDLLGQHPLFTPVLQCKQ